MPVVRTEADEPTSNADLLEEEIEQAAAEGEADGVDEPGPGGLEGVAPDSFAPEAAPADEVPPMAGLPSAEEASYDVSPVFAPESVIDEDERVRITTTDRYPWRVHAALRITARDGSLWIGTAFFIAPRVLATAGHNLFINGRDPSRRGWVRSIQVMPGRDGNSLPFGSAISTRFYSVRGWTESADPEFDYGAIILDPDDRLGAETGWLGFAAYGDATLRSTTGNLSGYPKDRGNGREQWYMSRRIDSVSGRKVFYDIDTFGGQSGSAVYRIKDGHRYAVGIHAYGVGSRPLNSATRVSRPVFDNLLAWKNAHP
jgi:V8-like Glu-specific endopeptidase